MQREQHEYVLSRQLLKSGTSIGANTEEAAYAQSKSDFIAKIFIALKEANETRFWLRLIKDSNLIPKNMCEQAQAMLEEIIAMLMASAKTA